MGGGDVRIGGFIGWEFLSRRSYKLPEYYSAAGGSAGGGGKVTGAGGAKAHVQKEDDRQDNDKEEADEIKLGFIKECSNAKTYSVISRKNFFLHFNCICLVKWSISDQ